MTDTSLPAFISHVLTILGIVLTRILFVSKNFSQAMNMFKSLINFTDHKFYNINSGFSEKICLFSFLIGLFIIFFTKNTTYKMQNIRITIFQLVVILIVLFLSIVFMGRGTSFLYFQF